MFKSKIIREEPMFGETRFLPCVAIKIETPSINHHKSWSWKWVNIFYLNDDIIDKSKKSKLHERELENLKSQMVMPYCISEEEATEELDKFHIKYSNQIIKVEEIEYKSPLTRSPQWQQMLIKEQKEAKQANIFMAIFFSILITALISFILFS